MRKRIRQAALLQGVAPARVWSVRFDDTTSSPVGVRADLARGLVAEVAVGNAKVRNDFDNIPIFDRPLFNATWDESTGRWCDFVGRGEEGFTLKPTAANREVLYRSVPFWYQLALSDAGRITRVSVSDRPLEGYCLAPMFRDGNTPVYRPAFEAAMDYKDRKMHSRAGLTPYMGEPGIILNMMRDVSPKARFETAAEWFSDYLLLLVEFATCNLQGVMHGYCGEETVFFNARENSTEYPTGLYCSEKPFFEKGERVTLYVDNGMGEYYAQGSYAVADIVTVTGVGYRVEFSGLDVQELMRETRAWKCSCEVVKTGTALSVVTNASSGSASESLLAPIVWRGKENPWGNVPNLLYDVGFKMTRGGDIQFCHAAKGREICFNEENAYLPEGELLTPPASGEGFIMGMALDKAGDFLYPISFADAAPDKYFATRVDIPRIAYMDEDTVCAVLVGGGCWREVATNHATMEVVAADSEGGGWNRVGGRMILEET